MIASSYLLVGLGLVDDFEPLQLVLVPLLILLTSITWSPAPLAGALLAPALPEALVLPAPSVPVPPAAGDDAPAPARDPLPLISGAAPAELAELFDTFPVTSIDSPTCDARRDVSAPAGICSLYTVPAWSVRV